MNEWISVKDGLPQVGKDVLVSTGTFVVQGYRDYDSKWKFSKDALSKHTITHWMPLPEPPKPEKEKKPMNYKTLDRINELDLKIESNLSKIKAITFYMGDAFQAIDDMKYLTSKEGNTIKRLIRETYENKIEEIQQQVDQDTDTLNDLKESLPRLWREDP